MSEGWVQEEISPNMAMELEIDRMAVADSGGGRDGSGRVKAIRDHNRAGICFRRCSDQSCRRCGHRRHAVLQQLGVRAAIRL